MAVDKSGELHEVDEEEATVAWLRIEPATYRATFRERLWDDLNRRYNTLFGEYETELVDGELLAGLRIELQRFMATPSLSAEVVDNVATMIEFLGAALVRRHSVWVSL